MNSVEKILLTISMTICIIFAVFAVAVAIDMQNKTGSLEKRLLTLETKITLYENLSAVR